MQHSETFYNQIAENRGKLQRFFFAAVFLILLYKLYAKLLISQTGMNPLVYQEIDPTYWLFMLAEIPRYMNGPVAVIFDIMLLASCLLSSIFSKQRFTTIVFFCCYFIYFVLFNMMAGHHYANIAIVIISFVFIFKDKLFGFSFQFSRFAFLFIMCSAAIWKIARGNLFYPHQLEMIMLSHNFDRLAAGDMSLKYQLVKWVIQHPWVSHSIWISMIAMELSFVLGFFTLKKDTLLLILYLLFALGGYLLTGIFAVENLLFLFTLYPVVLWITQVSFFSKNIFSVRGNRE